MTRRASEKWIFTFINFGFKFLSERNRTRELEIKNLPKSKRNQTLGILKLKSTIISNSAGSLRYSEPKVCSLLKTGFQACFALFRYSFGRWVNNSITIKHFWIQHSMGYWKAIFRHSAAFLVLFVVCKIMKLKWSWNSSIGLLMLCVQHCKKRRQCRLELLLLVGNIKDSGLKSRDESESARL
jgi:hypothetical protein